LALMPFPSFVSLTNSHQDMPHNKLVVILRTPELISRNSRVVFQLASDGLHGKLQICIQEQVAPED
jgi:hypothetical protein